MLKTQLCKKKTGLRVPRQLTFCIEIEAGTLHGWQISRNKAVFMVRPVWATNRCRSAVIAMLCSSLRMLQFRLGMDWICRSTKQGCLSFAPARIRVGPNTCFSIAAAAAAAAAAACFCSGCLCCCCCYCCCCCCCCLLLLRVPLLLLLLHCLLV